MPPSYNQATSNLELRDYMSILRRRRVLIALITGAVVVVTLAYSLTRTPLYEAKAQVIIQSRESDKVLGANIGADADAIRREILLMQSNQYVTAVKARLGYLPKPDLEANTQVTPAVRITISNPDAARAAKEATDFAEAYVAERRKAIGADLAASVAEIKTQMGNLPIELAADREQIAALTLKIEASTDPAQTAVMQAQIDQLMAQVAPSATDGRMSILQGQLDQLNTAQASNAGKGRFVVSTAQVPDSPVYPTPARNALLALFGGLVLGLAVAFVRDYFDDTLRTKEDLDNASGGITVLGIIPAIDGWRDRGTARLESVSHPNSAASEAYRGLRTSIEFLAVDEKLRIIHVTSSTSGEGKSTTSANLAVTLARAGKRVILIDCDLRRPRLHQFFGMDNSVGFTSVVLGSSRIEDAVVPVPGVPGLLVLSSGPPPPNPSELLSTKTVQAKLDALAQSADYVVIDSPPLLPVSDSIVIAGLADITVLVVTARTTARRSLHRSIELLGQVDAPLEGIVFNGVGNEGTYGYGYGYGYNAYTPSRPEKGAKKNKKGAPDTTAFAGHLGARVERDVEGAPMNGSSTATQTPVEHR